MKNKLNWWCDRAWILLECLLAGVMMCLMLFCWETWGTDVKVICAVSILLPMHVVEEWVFPGGFHYQYNVGVFGSEVPDRYPMCRLSDMYTNLIGTVFFMVLTFAAMANGNTVRPGILMATAVFAGMEALAHTLLGCKMYFRFKSRGKRTIYGPGSLTAYFGFAPLGVIAFYCIRGQQIGQRSG